MDFMTQDFGAQGLFRLEAAEGVVGRIEIKIGDVVVKPFDGRPEQRDAPGYLRLYVPECEETLRNATAAGTEAVTRPPYLSLGDMVARVRDPYGNVWWSNLQRGSAARGARSTGRATGMRRGDGILLGSRASLEPLIDGHASDSGGFCLVFEPAERRESLVQGRVRESVSQREQRVRAQAQAQLEGVPLRIASFEKGLQLLSLDPTRSCPSTGRRGSDDTSAGTPRM